MNCTDGKAYHCTDARAIEVTQGFTSMAFASVPVFENFSENDDLPGHQTSIGFA